MCSPKPDIAIFGSGAWGAALAITWARQGKKIILWGHPAEAIRDLQTIRIHPRLPGTKLPDDIELVTEQARPFKHPSGSVRSQPRLALKSG